MAEMVNEFGLNVSDVDQIVSVRRYTNLLLMSTEGLEEAGFDNALAARYGASIVLADAIADRNTGDAAGNEIVETLRERASQDRSVFSPEASVDDDKSILDLYAIWGVIKQARENHQDAVLPADLIKFVSHRAEKLGEHEIAFDLVDKFAVYKRLDETLEKLSVDEGMEAEYTDYLAESLAATPVGLSEISERLALLLEENVVLTCAMLNLDPKNQDKTLIDSHSRSSDDLYMALLHRTIRSEVGRSAAMALHDRIRLMEHGKTASSLYSSIKFGLYMTDLGKYVAMARHDMLYLDKYARTPESLRMGLSGLLFTDAGKTKAKWLLELA